MRYLTIAEAAERLAMTPLSLRKRCTSNARRVGKDVKADLGHGIKALRFGRIWRVTFPSQDQDDT